MITIKKLKDKLSKYANKEDGKIYVKSIENGEPLINTITIFEKNYIKIKSDDTVTVLGILAPIYNFKAKG